MNLILKQMGKDDVSEEQVAALLKKYDLDGDSTIDFGEFLEMFSHFKAKKDTVTTSDHSQGDASTQAGARGHHTFLHEEVKMITRLFNKILAKDEFVADRVPMPVNSEDLFHCMSDGMMLIRVLAAIDKDCVDMRTVNKGHSLNIYKIRENIDYGLTCA